TFRGKIVVVGPWAETLHDVHPTSTGDSMAGAEIQANAIETALRRFPLQSAPGWFDILVIVLFGLLPVAGGLTGRLFWTLGPAVVAGIGYAAAALVVAFRSGWILSVVYPTGTLVLSSVGALASHYLLAAFERE